MLYKFDVKLDDKEYIEYNKFHLTKSHYSKKSRFLEYAALAFIFILALAYMFFAFGFNYITLISCIPIVILFTVLLLVYRSISVLFVKLFVKIQKSSGKLAYSPSATIEIHEDCFVEDTALNMTETKYGAIERVSVTERGVYMHTNAVAAYIIPTASFESPEQMGELIAFLAERGAIIDRYTGG